MKVLKFDVGKEPIITEIANEIHPMQEAVGGYFKTVILDHNPQVILVCCEDAEFRQLPKNRSLIIDTPFGQSVNTLYGDYFICGNAGSEFADYDESTMQTIVNQRIVDC